METGLTGLLRGPRSVAIALQVIALGLSGSCTESLRCNKVNGLELSTGFQHPIGRMATFHILLRGGGGFWSQELHMSAGFDACNLNALPIDFVGSATHSHATNSKRSDPSGPMQVEAEASEKLASSACDQANCVSGSQDIAGIQSDAERNELADEPQRPVVVLPEKLQRVAEAREQQGFSLRTIARRTGIDLRTLRSHENPTTDMKLSELRRWQLALEVPMVDLIEDDAQPLSSPVRDRANLVRIMKTVVAIKEAGGSPRIQRLAEMLFEQMVELMPELKEIGGWPQHGSRRSSGSSRIIEQQIDTQSLGLDRLE